MKIAGSFLQIQDNKEKIDLLNGVCDYMHYDIMDGIFTENATLDIDVILQNTKDVTIPKDVHLMVKDIKGYADIYSVVKPEIISFHYEATTLIDEMISYIKNKGIGVGIAINPGTDVLDITSYLDKIDMVLVMSVVAGAGGQKFIDISDKIDYLDRYRKDKGLDYIIEVDGGINNKTISNVLNADRVVVGSYITSSGNYYVRVKNIKFALRNGFTLAELLGVLVILGVIAGIVFMSISRSLSESRIQACKVQEKTIKEAAKNYFVDKKTETKATISQLISGGYLDADIKNPITNEKYKGTTQVVKNGNSYSVEYKNGDKDCVRGSNSAVLYMVTFNCTANGGNTCSFTQNLHEGESINLSQTASKSGYTFVGWNTNQNAHSGLGSKSVTSDVTLYAIFKKVETINISFSKGTGVSSIGRTSTSCEIVKYNNESSPTTCSITLPSITASSGYNSPKWYSGSTQIGTAGQTINVGGNVTYTAKATANPSSSDTTAPVITISPNGKTLNNTLSVGSVTITVTDSGGSGLKSGETLAYAWGTQNYSWPGDYDEIAWPNTAGVSSKSKTITLTLPSYNTTYYLWIGGFSDVAGNSSRPFVSAAFKATGSNQCCFMPGTMVQTDLEGHTKEIEKFEIGDTVVVQDIVTGKKIVTKTLKEPHEHKETLELATITLDNGIELTFNSYHPIYTTEGYKTLTTFKDYPKLCKGDMVILFNGTKSKIKDIKMEQLDQPITTYTLILKGINDFYLEDQYGYFANDVLVHTGIDDYDDEDEYRARHKKDCINRDLYQNFDFDSATDEEAVDFIVELYQQNTDAYEEYIKYWLNAKQYARYGEFSRTIKDRINIIKEEI